MQYIKHYNSPLGDLLMTANEQGLTGLWLEGQRTPAQEQEAAKRDTVSDCPALIKTAEWLDLYFKGRDPGFLPPIHMEGTGHTESKSSAGSHHCPDDAYH